MRNFNGLYRAKRRFFLFFPISYLLACKYLSQIVASGILSSRCNGTQSMKHSTRLNMRSAPFKAIELQLREKKCERSKLILLVSRFKTRYFIRRNIREQKNSRNVLDKLSQMKESKRFREINFREWQNCENYVRLTFGSKDLSVRKKDYN